MPATILDGKATAATTRGELTERVARLVGDDPGSRWHVSAKHSDCAQVGIASIQRELPATATEADVLAVGEELDADPACTGYIVQLPLPAGIGESAILEAVDPAEDVDGLHPVNPGRLVLNVPGPLPCTPVGLITADMVKPGAAVLDVGVSRVDGAIAGDVALDVVDVAGHVAPDPGGVGPMTWTMLVRNVVLAVEHAAAPSVRA